MWELGPLELDAVYAGARRRRREDRRLEFERRLFTAYMTVLFWAGARVGTLEPWESYRARWFGTDDAPTKPPVDSMMKKEQRRQQIDMFRKHEARRRAPVVRRPRA